MSVLVVGSKGQLGRCLYDQLVKTDYEVFYASRSDFDIGDFSSLDENISLLKPNVVINASAYTAVDKAECEQQLADLINHRAVAKVANVCKALNAWFIHISIDYVFDGANTDLITKMIGRIHRVYTESQSLKVSYRLCGLVVII